VKIEVRYLAQVRHAVGHAGETLAVEPPCTVAELVRLLPGRHEALRGLLTDDRGGVLPSLLLFVGAEQVTSVSQPLRDGDVLLVLSPMAGG
jgi:molybdopterin converting factor small subunit